MIFNSSGGGTGLFVRGIVVTDKSSLPTDADEGTVAIVSSAVTSIPDIRICREEPTEDIASGTLWIVPAISGAKLYLNVLKKQCMVLGTAKLYDGSAWNEVPVFVKGSDGWNSSGKYWFESGKGFLFDSSSGGGSQSADTETLTMRYTDNSIAYRWSKDKIDLSAYSLMHINIKANGATTYFTFGLGNSSHKFDLASSKPSVTTDYTEFTLDISAVDTSDCYINLSANGAYGGSQPLFTINNIWFT